MLNECYTFNELKEKFGWTTTESGIAKQITYAKNRGVNIEFAFKQGKSYFRIISQPVSNEEWRVYPHNDYYEVSNTGKIRTTQQKKLVGSVNVYGYITLSDQRQTPHKHYRAHRMVMETFCPIENSYLFDVDHIDGNRQNNNISNLRWVNSKQNMQFRDDRWAELSQNLQKLAEKRGADWVNRLLLFNLE